MRGTGTRTDPFIIEDVNDVQDIELNLAAFYELESDIDASATIGWNGGAGFMPIALASHFSGSLDGKGYRIINLHMNYNLPGATISMIDDNRGSIANLGLVNITFLGIDPGGPDHSGGGFVNSNYGTIRNCYITGYLDGHDVGGICRTNWPVWGLPALVSNCWADVRMVASDECAPIMYANGGTVQICYATGEVAGDIVSGLVSINDGLMENCYSRTRVTSAGGTDVAAGLTEANEAGAIIRNCYSTGAVSDGGSGNVGGLCQWNAGAIENCFWDVETSGQPTSVGGTGLGSALMKLRATFVTAGWNFNSIWEINSLKNSGYPFFGVAIGVVTKPATKIS